MARVGIVTDSTACTPRGVAEFLGIVTVPMTVALGDREYLDGVDLQADDFYYYSDPSRQRRSLLQRRKVIEPLMPAHARPGAQIRARRSGCLLAVWVRQGERPACTECLRGRESKPGEADDS